MENADPWTKAGVMIRETLAAGSAHASMIVTPGGVKGLAFQRRTAANASSTHTSGGAGTAPKWVKLTRSGATITAFVSDNGVNWLAVGSDTFAMGATVHVGLAVSSHNDSLLATATFDNEVFYYISQTRKRPVAFANAKLVDQRVLAVYFGEDGRVGNIANYGLKDGKIFDFISRTTPTGGKDMSFLAGMIAGVGKGGAPSGLFGN